MSRSVAAVKCTHIMAQVSLGYYDEEGNLLGEEAFPQEDGRVLTARLFHPRAEQLEKLVAACIEQAWRKLIAQSEVGDSAALQMAPGERTAIQAVGEAGRAECEPVPQHGL
jgi:hypothetical protein